MRRRWLSLLAFVQSCTSGDFQRCALHEVEEGQRCAAICQAGEADGFGGPTTRPLTAPNRAQTRAQLGVVLTLIILIAAIEDG